MFSGSWISPYIRKGRKIVQTELEDPVKPDYITFCLLPPPFWQDLLEESRSYQKRLDKLLKICYTIRVVRKVRFLKNKKRT